MRILGVDYGQARIGLAISDPTGLFAQSLTVLPRASDEAAAQAVARLATEHEADRIVVGLPRNMDGSEGETASRCRRFARRLADVTGLPVDLYDERLTTAAAQRLLVEADLSRRRRKQVVDAVAAAMLLQGYLERQRTANQNERGSDSSE